ncbi:MAG: hypothetical protein ACRCYQ_06125 [Nocardioides sp.]
MPKRVSVPAADHLFRPTAARELVESAAAAAAAFRAAPVAEVAPRGEAEPGRRSSGRVRHDEKMTIYVTGDELLDLEQARLSMRRVHGVSVDRGRLVREAVAIALADLEENGSESVLIQRLSGT